MTTYNVECRSCGQIFNVNAGPLWWKAKKAADAGRLDAITVSGVECGCKRPVLNPDASYRVFGFSDEGREYNTPCSTFTEAVNAFRDAFKSGETVFIKGVSRAVKERLMYG